MIRHLLEYINTWMHVAVVVIAASLFPSRAQPPFSLLQQQQLFYNTCSRINLVRRDRTDWFIHRFLIPRVPSTYVPYIFQNVLLLVVLWAQWENIVAKCVTFKVRIIDLKPVSPIEGTVKKRKVKILLMFSGGVAHPVTFSDWVGPTVHCRPTLILPKYRVRASKKSQAAWTVRYELGTTLWRKSWGTAAAAAGFYESVHNSKSLSKLGCCVIYRCSHQQFGVCSPERERESLL